MRLRSHRRLSQAKAEASFSTPNAGASAEAVGFSEAYGVLRLAGAFGRNRIATITNDHSMKASAKSPPQSSLRPKARLFRRTAQGKLSLSGTRGITAEAGHAPSLRRESKYDENVLDSRRHGAVALRLQPRRERCGQPTIHRRSSVDDQAGSAPKFSHRDDSDARRLSLAGNRRRA